MKWNILVGSLVLGLGLSAQSFGADLLDRMLGMNYNGCCETASCCETTCCDPGPSCGCEDPCAGVCSAPKKCRKTPLLDLLRGCRKSNNCCEPACGVEDPCCEPACGCEDPCCEPACGCEDPCAGVCSAPKKCRKTPLLDLLRGCRKSKNCCEPACGCEDPCCEPACGCEDPCCEPACGCEDPCAGSSCCKPKRVSLLERIFGRCRKANNCCSEPACGCEDPCCEPACGCEDPCCEPACGCEDPCCGHEAGPAPAAAEPKEAGDDAEQGPPAPVVDPTAFLPTQRRFIQTNLVR